MLSLAMPRSSRFADGTATGAIAAAVDRVASALRRSLVTQIADSYDAARDPAVRDSSALDAIRAKFLKRGRPVYFGDASYNCALSRRIDSLNWRLLPAASLASLLSNGDDEQTIQKRV